MVHSYNLCTGEVETEGLRVQGQLWLCSKSEASLSYKRFRPTHKMIILFFVTTANIYQLWPV